MCIARIWNRIKGAPYPHSIDRTTTVVSLPQSEHGELWALNTDEPSLLLVESQGRQLLCVPLRDGQVTIPLETLHLPEPLDAFRAVFLADGKERRTLATYDFRIIRAEAPKVVPAPKVQRATVPTENEAASQPRYEVGDKLYK